MAAAAHAPSGPNETFVADFWRMFSFLIDPAAAATRLSRKWFWVWPFLVVSAATMFYSMVSGPMSMHYAETAPMPANVTAAQYAQQLRIQAAILKVMPLLMPLMVMVLALIQTGLLLATSSMLAVKARFLELFNLVQGCGIIGALQMIAWAIILMLKHEISTPQDIRPPLGIDIFLPEGTNKFLMAVLGYFTIFTVWSLVMMVLTYSEGFRTTKGKAATAVSPLYLLGVFFALIGAAFQKG